MDSKGFIIVLFAPWLPTPDHYDLLPAGEGAGNGKKIIDRAKRITL
jgi:hypothetical protein